ncbi:MAG: D-alanyl-D-alanine carboxypeptidase [Rhizobiaceae bacterium]|nr:D-alanyl-D-alanine carboxypeptidase [Rhizobiaceae bacterium]
MSDILNKRFSAKLLVLLSLVFFGLSNQSLAAGPYIAVDVKSGRVVQHSQAFQKWYPASLTKLMTAYVVFREIKAGRLSFDSRVAMSQYAASKPASKMYFKPGTEFTIDSGLKYLLVKSANDVAVAIGERVAGSEAKFVAMMNREAKRLGMNNTRFVNPNGLPGNGQYTNAYDMAVLGVALKKEFPKYKGYFSLGGVSTGKRTYPNYNLLLGRFSGADGMKTGYICASGFNLVSSATRGGKSIVAVVLGAKSQEERAGLAANLLQAGFSGKRSGGKLAKMRPYGQNRNQLANIRNQICTKEARAARLDGRDLEVKIREASPYIKALKRAPKISSAPYSNPKPATKFSNLKNVPIPAPTLKR